jgi:type IV pilus assembly protein PilB
MAKKVESGALGDILVKQEVITKEDLEKAKQEEAQSGTPWHRLLLNKGKVTVSGLQEILQKDISTSLFQRKAGDAPTKATNQAAPVGLGEALLQMKAISKKDLDDALALQKKNGRFLGKILLEKGVAPAVLAQALGKQFGLPVADISKTPTDAEALKAVPESVALKNNMVPIRIEGNKVIVLISDPTMRGQLESAGVILGKQIQPMITACDNIREEIKRRYAQRGQQLPVMEAEKVKPGKGEKSAAGKKGAKDQPDNEGKKAVSEKTNAMQKARFDEIAKQAQGVPVVKLVSTIVEGAANSGATDVHLDPQDPEMRVRYRIDGVLHDVMSIPRESEPAVVSRLKIMADMDITETRRPQDGHISMEFGDSSYDVRVATMPTFLGERIVLRMLDQTAVLAGIKDLGLESEDEKIVRAMIEQPYGMVLVTGPTGSGKTTTLYASLNQKNVMTDSIVTLEDPVEYQLSGINQVQIDTDIDLTFANTLRASLRQDIDVLLVGEIRDGETARIAVRAAMTGHLVFSTLHTNDAPEAISTLRNMGVPSYLISSALTGIIGQRLVRKICPNCKEAFVPGKDLLKSVGLLGDVKKLYRGRGCDSCYNTGTRGRTGIFEILEISGSVRKAIAAEDTVENIVKLGKLKTMADRCRQKMKSGVIAPEEFLRVIRT